MLIVALYGYYIAIKQSPRRDIRKNNLDYECFRCKEKFSINLKKCLVLSNYYLWIKKKILDDLSYFCNLVSYVR